MLTSCFGGGGAEQPSSTRICWAGMLTGQCPIHCPQVYFRSDKAGMRPEELQARQRQAQEMQAALQQQIEEKKRIKVGPDGGSRRASAQNSAGCTPYPGSSRFTAEASQMGPAP